MDRTVVGPGRVDVRGGTLTLVTGESDIQSVHIGPEPRIVGRRPGCHMVLQDRKVSATHCELVATPQGVRVRDLGSTNGTFIGTQRVVETILVKAASIQCGDSILELRPGRLEPVPMSKHEQFGALVGSTPRMRALFEQLRLVSPTTVSVLIQGETGTGKEVVARAIHGASDRAAKPFVVVDCSAIPSNLAESTLFGHERGAFTGASERRKGALEEADGGTLFLDELGELPLETQPKLLRVLADQRVKRVGSNTYAPVDVRVVAATRRDLLVEINRGGFRDDLYFRIAEERLDLVPLRERMDDLRSLVEQFTSDFGNKSAYRRIPTGDFDRLSRHDWPGNVRELRSLVKRALAYDRGGPLELGSRLSESPSRGRSPGRSGGEPSGTLAEWRDRQDKIYFAWLVEATGNNVSEIARRAELQRRTVRESLERHGLRRRPRK